MSESIYEISRRQEKVGSKIFSYCIIPLNTISDVTFPSGETPLMYLIFSVTEDVVPLQLKGCLSEECSRGEKASHRKQQIGKTEHPS